MRRYRVHLPKARPCIVMSIELLPRSDDPLPFEMQLNGALEVVEDHFERVLLNGLDRRVLVTDRRVTSLTPIVGGGTSLFRVLLHVVHLQSKLSERDVLMRGAVTFGDVEMRPDFAAGAGVVEAERLRDEVALVPRIVVDPRVIVEVESNPLLRAQHHTVRTELEYIKSLLRRDTDGLWFIDYLAVCIREAEDPHPILEGHHRLVERRLEAAKTLDGTSRSTTWLWSYHNEVVEKLLDQDQRAERRIPPKSPLVYVFPSPVSPVVLESRDIPQADDLDQVLQVVTGIAFGQEAHAESLGPTPRRVAYHRRAAQILGLLSESNELTVAGRQIARLDAGERLRATVVYFESSRVGDAWIRWSGGRTLLDVDPEKAYDFLRESTPDLSDATARRRAQTLVVWHRALVKHHYARC